MNLTVYEYMADEEFYLSDTWAEIKEDIFERDAYRCRVCGSTERLSVHHIIPRKYKYMVNFDIDSVPNLVTLCWGHHEMADHKVDVVYER